MCHLYISKRPTREDSVGLLKQPSWEPLFESSSPYALLIYPKNRQLFKVDKKILLGKRTAAKIRSYTKH